MNTKKGIVIHIMSTGFSITVPYLNKGKSFVIHDNDLDDIVDVLRKARTVKAIEESLFKREDGE